MTETEMLVLDETSYQYRADPDKEMCEDAWVRGHISDTEYFDRLRFLKTIAKTRAEKKVFGEQEVSEEDLGILLEKGYPATREDFNRAVLQLYRPLLSRFPDLDFKEYLMSTYGVEEVRFLTLLQYRHLVGAMKGMLDTGRVA